MACNLAHAESACVGGSCSVVKCDEPFADCDGQAENGCETNLSSDSDNCGACGTTCVAINGVSECADYECTIQCAEGFDDCDEDPSNGCERDVRRDVNHCGRCGRVCEAETGTPWCDDGTCGVSDCPAGFGDCNANPADGCEADLTKDPTNCHDCGTLCLAANGSASCGDSVCEVESCDDGYEDCNPGTEQGYVDGCETNVDDDVENCGGCGDVCAVANATPRCSEGTCGVLSCTAPWADCDDDGLDCEVNTDTNSENCGGCGTNGVDCEVAWGGTRHADGVCDTGSCEFFACQGSWRDCNDDLSDGCEVDIDADDENCGACDVVCEAPFGTNTCVDGDCAPNCGGTYLDCDADPTTGCEVDPDTDEDNCGGCSIACLDNNTSSNLCVDGACDPNCTQGFSDCDTSRPNGCEVYGSCGSGGSGGGPTVLFSDDFESGAGAWQIDNGGTWSITSDGSSVYAQSEMSNTLRMASAGSTSWTDVMAQVRVKALSFGGISTSNLAGLCVRRQNVNNLYLVGIRSDGRVGIRRRVAGSFNNLNASQAGLVTTGVWYTLRVELVGATMAVYLDDSLVISESDSTHSSGSIGLCTVNTSARFDDVVVTTL